MPDPENSPSPEDFGVTLPVQRTPVPTPAPAGQSKPTASHYVAELPLAEELQAMLEGRYVVESFLGQGGMGAVYKGLQMPLRRPVAIKILAKRGEGDDFAFEERFKREAYAMAALTHPHIVQVYDCGDAGENFLFISMELVEGGDLAQAIKSGQCMPDVALKLILQICDGLQAAHERGLVHRDIKPANIFLTADGRAKVADFGLAKKFDAQSTFATKTGMAMGTPDYAAPEQFDALPDIDQRADVYSLGVMFYQMLTGTLPRGNVRPASQRVGTDPRLDAVLGKAMEHDRAERYQSVAEMKADIVAITGVPQRTSVTALRTAAVPVQQTAVRTGAVPVQEAARSSRPVAQRPSVPSPGSVPMAAARTVARPRAKKGGMGMFIGIGAAAVLAMGAFFAFKKPAPNPAATDSATAPRFSPSSEPWVDRMNDPVVAKKGNLKREGSAWRLDNLTQFYFPEVMTDGAVRLLCSIGNDGTSPSIALRSASSKTNDGYGLGFHTSPMFQLNQNGRWTSLGKTALRYPPSVPKDFFGHPIEVELRAIGSRITAKINGEVVASADDTTFKSGIYRMQLSKGTIIHGLQTLDLSKPAPIPVVAGVVPKFSASTEPWVDRMAEIPMDKARREGAGVRFDSLLHLKLPPAFTDGAVRFLFTPGPMKQDAGLHLRVSGASDRNYYALGTTIGYCVLNAQSADAPSRGLAPVVTHDMSVFAPDKTVVEMELRTVGRHIEGKLNGRTVFAVDDNAFSSGFARVVIPTGTLVYGVQTLDLSRPAPSDPSGRKAASSASPSASATKSAPFVNSLGMKFVPVPITGGPTGGKRVLFSVWETRVQDWEAYKAAANKPLTAQVDFTQGPTHPVANVSWEWARDFCVWLTDQERKSGKLGAGERYRLPSDHEWSCAVGIGNREDATKRPAEKSGGIRDAYPWGNGWPPPAGTGNFAGEEVQPLVDGKKYPTFLKDFLRGYRDDFVETAPVGSFPANAYGLHDLAGNVFEWCGDAMEAGKDDRVSRGGSWVNSTAFYFLSSNRMANPPTYLDRSRGFRCVLAEQ